MKYTECPNKESCDASAIVCAEGRQCNYLAAKLAECQCQRDELLTALEQVRKLLDDKAQAVAFYGEQPQFELDCLAVLEPAIAKVRAA